MASLHGKEADRSRSGTPRVRLATFNLLNLALPEHEYYPGQFFTRELYEKKVDWIARQLIVLDADVVGFQEVFHRGALEEAIKRTGIYDLDKPIEEGGARLHVADETGDLPRVAILSRLPIRGLEIIRNFPQEGRLDTEDSELPWRSFHRPVLRALVEFPGREEATVHLVTVYVVHLKSKRPLLLPGEDRHNAWHEARGQARSLMLRACEVAALRWRILQEVQGTQIPLILLGDFNDSTHAVTSDILQGKQPQKNYPPDVRNKLWDVLLYACADIQQRRSFKDVYYTHLHNSHYESLDHILVSQEFVNENPRHIAVVEYMRLYNDHLLDPALTDERPPVWQSDHGQVLVSLRMT